MTKAPWTYELPAAGGETGGLEEYVVYAADGDAVGKVTVVLRVDEDFYLVVDRGEPPLTHDRRAVPWADVESVDHSALAVTLAQPASNLDRAPELDPGKAVEPKVDEQRARADAVRVTRLPENVMPVTVPADAPRAADRPFLYGGALALGLFAVFLVLVGVALVTAGAGGWSLIAFVGASAARIGVAGHRLQAVAEALRTAAGGPGHLPSRSPSLSGGQWTQTIAFGSTTNRPRSSCARSSTFASGCSDSRATISGIAVAFVGRPRAAAELRGVGLFGVLATIGIGITVQFLGFLPVSHGLGLGLVNSAAIAGWRTSPPGRAAGDRRPEAQATGAAIGGVAGVIVLFEVERLHRRAGWRAAAAR